MFRARDEPVRMRLRLGALLLVSVVAACSAPATDEDVSSGDDASALTGPSAPAPSCNDSDATLFFHGLGGAGRELGGGGVCAPAIANDGATGFWSNVAYAKAPDAKIVGGYSAGRIPFLRRLEADTTPESTAVLLDGSWADGARFDGKTGPAIVQAWLGAETTRRFILVHLDSSAGWREYAALAESSVGDRVTVCAITHGTHLELPGIVGKDLFADPDTWLTERCPNGQLQ